MLRCILSPVSESNSFGNDINYDSDFELIKTEIAKLEDINTAFVIEKSLFILKQKSKDLRILFFLSFIYLRCKEWEAFTDIFDGLSRLVSQNYEALHPIRFRAKQQAFMWLSEQRYKDLLELRTPPECASPHITRLLSALETVKVIIDNYFPDGSPFPHAIYTTAQKWEKRIKPGAQPEKKSGKELCATTSPMPTPLTDTAAVPESGAHHSPLQTQNFVSRSVTTIAEARSGLKKYALFLIENEPKKPTGYRILRSLRWDMIEKGPRAENGRTRLEPLPEERTTFLHNCIAKNNWKKVLHTAEKLFSCGPTAYWIDLQRMSTHACISLGDDYNAVYQAICIETAHLVKRIPDIVDLSFSDGTPFCDTTTRNWIVNTIVPLFSSQNSESVSQKPVFVPETHSISETAQEEEKSINSLMAEGNVISAIETLQKIIHESGNQRNNFKRYLRLCELLIGARHSAIALPILESLDNKVARYNLHQWEPVLAVDVWCLLAKAYKNVIPNMPQASQEQLLEKQNMILHKIYRIDVRRGLSFNH